MKANKIKAREDIMFSCASFFCYCKKDKKAPATRWDADAFSVPDSLHDCESFRIYIAEISERTREKFIHNEPLPLRKTDFQDLLKPLLIPHFLFFICHSTLSLHIFHAQQKAAVKLNDAHRANVSPHRAHQCECNGIFIRLYMICKRGGVILQPQKQV